MVNQSSRLQFTHPSPPSTFHVRSTNTPRARTSMSSRISSGHKGGPATLTYPCTAQSHVQPMGSLKLGQVFKPEPSAGPTKRSDIGDESLSYASQQMPRLSECQLKAQHDAYLCEVREKKAELARQADLIRQLDLVPDQNAAEVLGLQHPVAVLEASRDEVQAQLDHVEAQMGRAADYSMVLQHILHRTNREKVKLVVGVQELRKEGAALEQDFSELQLLSAEARGAASQSLSFLHETRRSLQRNKELYARRIAERKRMHDEIGRMALQQAHRQVKRGALPVSSVLSAGKDLHAGEEDKLRRMLVATRMSSLVLLQARVKGKDEQVEQVSRYEAAFLKMARAAGSNDAQVIISKFLGRDEMRARLQYEREDTREEHARLEEEVRRLHTRMAEMQHSLVHPHQSEAAVRDVESAYSRARIILQKREREVADAHDLAFLAYNGCSALLSQLTHALKSVSDAGFSEPCSPNLSNGVPNETAMNRLLEQLENALETMVHAIETSGDFSSLSKSHADVSRCETKPAMCQRDTQLSLTSTGDAMMHKDPNIRVMPFHEDDTDGEEPEESQAQRRGLKLIIGAKEDDVRTREKLKKEADERVRRHVAKVKAREGAVYSAPGTNGRGCCSLPSQASLRLGSEASMLSVVTHKS